MEDTTGLEQSYLEEQFSSNIHIFKNAKVDLIDYINALKYVSLKQHMSNAKAWAITFPDRLAKVEAICRSFYK